MMLVWELKMWIEEHNISDNAEVLIERVKDIYFKKHWRKTEKRSWEYGDNEYIKTHWCCKRHNDDTLYIDCHY